MRFRKKLAITIPELLTALAITIILLAIALPVMASARARGRQGACLSNMQQIAQASILYAGSNDGIFAQGDKTTWSWMSQIGLTASRGPEVYDPLIRCPSFVDISSGVQPAGPSYGRSGYAFNMCLGQENVTQIPTKVVIACEAACIAEDRPGGGSDEGCFPMLRMPDALAAKLSSGLLVKGDQNATPIGVWGAERHFGKGNYAFVDGHVDLVPPERFRIPATPCDASSPTLQGPPDGYLFAVDPSRRR